MKADKYGIDVKKGVLNEGNLYAQRDRLRKYAEYEDMVVAGEYSDEGFSGKNIQGRHEFLRMLQDIQDCKDGVEYVLVFKLSRFGQNAADVLNSLQLMQDFGVNLICVEDGIDSSKDSGKLMISVLSAVAEIERENIRTQTMAGREQKAREGKWNIVFISEMSGIQVDKRSDVFPSAVFIDSVCMRRAGMMNWGRERGMSS